MTAQLGSVIMEGLVTTELGIISVNVRLVIRVGSNKLKTCHPLKFGRAVPLRKLEGLCFTLFFKVLQEGRFRRCSHSTDG